MSKKTIIILVVVVLIAAGTIWYIKKGKELLMSTEKKREALIKYVNEPVAIPVFNQMTKAEIDASYNWMFNYVAKNKRDAPADLAAQITAISAKYNIFT